MKVPPAPVCRGSRQQRGKQQQQQAPERAIAARGLFVVLFHPFSPPLGYAGHDLLAEGQKQQDQGHGDDHYGGHHGRDVFPAKAVFPDLLDAVGHQIIGWVIGDQPGPHVGIPALNQLQDGDGHNGGPADGDHHLPQIFQIRGPVHLGGLVQLLGHLLKVFLQQIDVEHRGDGGQDQTGEKYCAGPDW